MKNVAGRPRAPRRASTRGTPTRAPYSPRCSIAGVKRSYPDNTHSASKSNVRQTRLCGIAADRTAPGAGRSVRAVRAAPTSVLAGGTVRTLDPERPRAAALVLSGGRIAAVLDDPADAPAGARRVDLAGACVVPGLVDAHVHFPSWALARRELRLFGCRSLAEALERVAAPEVGPGGWLRGAAGATSCGARSRRATRSTRSRRACGLRCARTTATRCG